MGTRRTFVDTVAETCNTVLIERDASTDCLFIINRTWPLLSEVSAYALLRMSYVQDGKVIDSSAYYDS